MSFYVLDRLINKPVCIAGDTPEGVSYGHKVVYKDDEWQEMVGIVLWYEMETTKKWTFLYALREEKEEKFTINQKKALDLFVTFKKDFKEWFPESVPVTARMNLAGNLVYFYFYAETRFQFADFVRAFRQKIGCNFFLYQVGARDRIRLDPRADGMYCASWHGTGLDCKMFRHPMPNVESDTVMLQQLEWRDVEKLKWLCGKLKCSLNYEKDYYESETKKYPHKWTFFRYMGDDVKCIGYNILTQEIKIRNDKTEQILKISLDDYQKILLSKQPRPWQ